MARSCTCQICKKKGNTDIFYKITDLKGKNKYYCNKEEYDQYIEEKNKRDELLKYMSLEVFEYDEGQIIPPVAIKKINELNKFYNYDVILACFKLNKDDIQYWIKVKNFSSEYGMFSYIFKIIESNINDVYNKWKFRQNQLQKEKSNTGSIDMLNQVEAAVHVNTSNNDISMFLEDGDM